MTSLERKGMGYLCGEGSDLSHFSQFVSKAEKILKCLRQSCNRMSDAHGSKSEAQQASSSKSNNSTTKKKKYFRYYYYYFNYCYQ